MSSSSESHFTFLGRVDPRPLLDQIDAQPGLWDQHAFRKTFENTAHSRMSDIWVRYNAYENLDWDEPWLFGEEHIPVWYPAWPRLPALRSLVFDLMQQVDGEMLGGIFITRLPPGEMIAPHADIGWHVEYFSKFYVTLRSAPEAAFACEHEGKVERNRPAPGDVYCFDNRKLHWVENETQSERITLIVTIRTEMYR